MKWYNPSLLSRSSHGLFVNLAVRVSTVQIACAKFVRKFRKNCSYVHEVFFVKFRIFCALKAILITRNIYICGKKIFICFICANANASIQEFSQTNQLFQNISIIDIEDQIESRFVYGRVRFKN